MKVKDSDNYWCDDNDVDFSKKERVYRDNYKISSKHVKFNPEDLTADINEHSINPSINKSAWHISDEFRDSLNRRSHLINRGENRCDGIGGAFRFAERVAMDKFRTGDK